MCAIGLTDSPSRYVIINEPKETDPLTLTHSYWPPSLPHALPPSLLHAVSPSIPSALLVRPDRVHPEMVNKSLSRTATTTSGVMGGDDLLSLSFPSFLHSFTVCPSLFSRYSNYSSIPETYSLASKPPCVPLWFFPFTRILNIQGQFNLKHHSPQPTLAHPVIRKPNYYHTAPLYLPHCLCQVTVQASVLLNIKTCANNSKWFKPIRGDEAK